MLDQGNLEMNASNLLVLKKRGLSDSSDPVAE